MEWWQALLGLAGTGIFSVFGSTFVSNRWARSAEKAAAAAATAAAAALETARVDRWDKFSGALETRLSRTETRLDDCEKQHSECEERSHALIREFEKIKGTVHQIALGGAQ